MALQVYRKIFCRNINAVALVERATLMTMSVPLMLSVRKGSSSFADQLPIVALAFEQSNRLDKALQEIEISPVADTLLLNLTHFPSLRR